MKKDIIITAIFFLFALSHVSAQSLDSIAQHYVGWYDVSMRNMLPLRDGTVLANCQLYELDSSQQFIVGDDYGNRFLKIDPDGPVVFDSAFIEDHDLNYFLVERNPFDNDNIYARAVRDLDNLRTDLCIRFFDDQLHFNDGKEVWVPLLSDTVFLATTDAYLLDKYGDIIIQLAVRSRQEHHFFRIGIDGTLKTHRILSYDEVPVQYTTWTDDLVLFNEEPLEYAYFGETPLGVMHVAVLDSLLNIKEDLVPVSGESGVELVFGYDDLVLNLDETSFLMSTQYKSGYNYPLKRGVHVTRYDKATCQPLKMVFFSAEPDNLELQALPIGIGVAPNGDVYYAYHTNFDLGTARVAVVRMDQDLNVIWQRYCLDEGLRDGSRLVILDDGSIAVGGMNWGRLGIRPPGFYFLFLDNNGVGIGEHADLLRPYTFYPNPACDWLKLECSPDVKPESVEVFDLQGRKVISQQGNLESIRTAELPSGVYSVRVTLEGGQSYTDKIVKQ